MECPVPSEQQPVNEYQSLSTSLPFSWATTDLPEYYYSLAVTGASFVLFIGLPVVAFGTGAIRDLQEYGVRCALGATSVGLHVKRSGIRRSMEFGVLWVLPLSGCMRSDQESAGVWSSVCSRCYLCRAACCYSCCSPDVPWAYIGNRLLNATVEYEETG